MAFNKHGNPMDTYVAPAVEPDKHDVGRLHIGRQSWRLGPEEALSLARALEAAVALYVEHEGQST